jgi:hypothetical protein
MEPSVDQIAKTLDQIEPIGETRHACCAGGQGSKIEIARGMHTRPTTETRRSTLEHQKPKTRTWGGIGVNTHEGYLNRSTLTGALAAAAAPARSGSVLNIPLINSPAGPVAPDTLRPTALHAHVKPIRTNNACLGLSTLSLVLPLLPFALWVSEDCCGCRKEPNHWQLRRTRWCTCAMPTRQNGALPRRDAGLELYQDKETVPRKRQCHGSDSATEATVPRKRQCHGSDRTMHGAPTAFRLLALASKSMP